MSSHLQLRGAGTALVTPFTFTGQVDLPRFRTLVRRQIEAGVRLLVPCGTTGESATLQRDEKQALVRACVEEAAGRALVIAGTGGNDTQVAVETAQDAATWGADAVLSLTPHYNKPPQDALVEHFSTVAEKAGVPVVLYNVPGRTGCNLDAETTLALATVPGIAGIKEASANMPQCMRILRDRPAGFAFLSGEDSLTWPFMALGAEGVISVVGNLVPDLLARLCSEALAGRADAARALHFALMPLMAACFVESNPIPVKAMLARKGWIEGSLRAPLRPLRSEHWPELERVLAAAGLSIAEPLAGALR